MFCRIRKVVNLHYPRKRLTTSVDNIFRVVKYKWTTFIAAGSRQIMCFPITKIVSLGSVCRKNWTEQSEKQTLLYKTSEKFTYRCIILVYWVVDVVEIEALNSKLKLQKKLVGFSLGFIRTYQYYKVNTFYVTYWSVILN